ncbi:MAG: DEAD/DEAH box helicase [Actinomycetota bacterium]|nr:DEAD/DEAH box helicase [Actinomycetota bacterium]
MAADHHPAFAAQSPDPLALFHPAVAAWFRRSYPAGPTEAQALGWRAIAAGRDALVSAPTGSGKTLAAFLVAIDRCYRAASFGEGRRGTDVVYVSPLRALTVDVAENLQRPIVEIAALARELGHPVPDVRVAVRNGDTSQSARAAMLRERPEIVVTTPESLYLLLTSARGRELLGTVRTVIVDEIHALARDKRGSHLALSLERLDRVVAAYRRDHAGSASPSFAATTPEAEGSRAERERPVRIGLSATQRPISTIASLLVGSAADRVFAQGSPICAVVDVGHRRRLDIAIELGDDELGAVATHEQLDEVLALIAEQVKRCRTTLVFVNTRRMAERVAHRLGEMVGPTVVAHHGSLSMERRLRVEERLRAGELRAVVATASLELGIDVGPVELVCQLGSPRSISTFLQRVGRAQHHVGGTPAGRLYPLTRDELVECAALFMAVRRAELDATVPPVAPLDILAQQIVAEVAATGPDGIKVEDLFELVKGATPYAALSPEVFGEVLDLVTDGVVTGRGRRGAYVHHDRVNSVLRPRRGARLAATTSGGAIPEVADYRVVLEPDDTVVGTVNEDWAIESMAGDVFLLGSHTWRIRRIEPGTVRVVDAEGASPSVPFWLGEAPARTDELSGSVSRLRSEVASWLDQSRSTAVEALGRAAGIDSRAAEQVVTYLATAQAELGALPTTQRLVVERFFDDTGGMQLVLHSPRGARINRGMGLVLRKRFCRFFDFELQAAASDDAVVLSLGPQHSFPLADVAGYLAPAGVPDTLVQAMLPTPMFSSRWRWNLSRSLVSPRFRGSRHLPPAIQAMEADDLMAAIFPMLAACQENVSGPIVIPDHPIVRQTVADCCTEAMDLAGLMTFLGQLRTGEVTAHFVDSISPSVLSEEILNGRPYTFLDDAPLEERRTRAVQRRRGTDVQVHELGYLDPEIVATIAEQVRPSPRDGEELHDLLDSLILVEPEALWRDHFALLVAQGRALEVRLPGEAGREELIRWASTARRAAIGALVEGAAFVPEPGPALAPSTGPAALGEDVLVEAVRGHLEVSQPLRREDLGELMGIGVRRDGEIGSALARLEREGSVLQCKVGDEQAVRYCARNLLMRIHAAARDRSRRSVQTFSARQFMAFLVTWQHAGPPHRLVGPDGLLEVVEQLQGIEAPVESWESAILPARIAQYRPSLLDELCGKGEVGFGRLVRRPAEGTGSVGTADSRRPGATPSPATPVGLFLRDDLPWLLAAIRTPAVRDEVLLGASADVVAALDERGALFFSDICAATGRMPVEVADALWEGIARGLVTADDFQAVRSLLRGRSRLGHLVGPSRPAGGIEGSSARVMPARHGVSRRGHVRARVRPALSAGRWSLLDRGSREGGTTPLSHLHRTTYDADELAEAVAGQLLHRWGVVFRDLVVRESLGIGWRAILLALRRLEARGIVRGGRFVTGFNGEQFALPEAYERLRTVSSPSADGHTVCLSAADPLNLTGVLVGGPRVPAVRTRTIVICDGVISEGRPGPARGHLDAESGGGAG